jgi:hypothetical protein
VSGWAPGQKKTSEAKHHFAPSPASSPNFDQNPMARTSISVAAFFVVSLVFTNVAEACSNANMCTSTRNGWYHKLNPNPEQGNGCTCSPCGAGGYARLPANAWVADWSYSTTFYTCGIFNNNGNYICNACGTCPPGTFSRDASASCSPCAPGFFADTAGSSFCLPCPAGTTSETGAVICFNSTSLPLPTEQPNCSLSPFPSSEVVGEVIAEVSVTDERTCRAECCSRSACMGYSFFRFSLPIPRCTLLSRNITYVVPSNSYTSAIRPQVLGF